MKAVILAGGKGTRLAPYTHILPKPMMPVGDRAILEVILDQLSRAGIKDITLAVGHLASLMQAYFGDGSSCNLKIRYAYEENPLGTAGPLAFVDGLTETFLVSNGGNRSRKSSCRNSLCSVKKLGSEIPARSSGICAAFSSTEACETA